MTRLSPIAKLRADSFINGRLRIDKSLKIKNVGHVITFVKSGDFHQRRYALPGAPLAAIALSNLRIALFKKLVSGSRGFDGLVEFMFRLAQKFFGFRAVPGHVVVIRRTSAFHFMDRLHDVIVRLI